MDVSQLLTIGIVGSALTGVVQIIKQMYGTEGTTTKLITIGLAVVIGALLYALQGSVYWPTLLGIIMVSQTIYSFFLK